MSVTCEYTSVGINRNPNAADWSHTSGIVALGAHNSIALYRPLNIYSPGIYALLKGHSGLVNAVRWVPRREEGNEILISGAADSTIRIWRENEDGSFIESQTFLSESVSVSSIAVLPQLFASGLIDGSIHIYTLQSTSVLSVPSYTLAQKLQLNTFYPLALDLTCLPNSSNVLLAVGGSSPNIHIYGSNDQKIDFVKCAALKGHEDWVRGLEFSREEGGSLLLASGSQDHFVRLWKIRREVRMNKDDVEMNKDVDSDVILSELLGGQSYRFVIPSSTSVLSKYIVEFEALLLGHDDWVFTVSWHPTKSQTLLSSSADTSLILWHPDPHSTIWTVQTRLGEVSSLKGSSTASGSSGGFWGGLWSPHGDVVGCWGKTGGWRMWSEVQEEENRWNQALGITGFGKAVKSISWERAGNYLLATGLDQTTRLFAPWNRHVKDVDVETWHEMARPQIHGYDINSISSMGEWRFVSGADEKVLRVFQAPKGIAHLVQRLSGKMISDKGTLSNSATQPVLGLSNKAIGAARSPHNDSENSPHVTDAPLSSSALENFTSPPLEDHLSRQTLFPEIEKLYGHGYELICTSVSCSGKLIASTCKAQSADHAVIRLFDSETWTEVMPPLSGHTLTVTRISWSSDDRYLVSVSRDRQWCLFERVKGEEKKYKLKQISPRSHGRIIWDVSWAPPHGDLSLFATGSRDKSVKIWHHGSMGEWDSIAQIKFSEGVTAVAFAPRCWDDKFVLAVGLENGRVLLIWALTAELKEWAILVAFDSLMCPSDAVTQLAWRPGSEGRWELASCSDDCVVKIFSIALGTAMLR